MKRGRMTKQGDAVSKALHELMFTPLWYRYSTTFETEMPLYGTDVSDNTVDSVCQTVFADEILLQNIMNDAYRQMGYPLAFCHPYQLFASAPHISTEPWAGRNVEIFDIVCECLLETAKVCASLGYFVPGRKKV
jgi:hypothetical protein